MLRYSLLAGLLLSLTACVVVAPVGESDNSSTGVYSPVDATGTNCQMKESSVTDISTGTQKVTVTETCTSVEMVLVNEHQEHPKKCTAVIGSQAAQLYIPVGEERIISRNKPLTDGKVAYTCINDWNRPR